MKKVGFLLLILSASFALAAHVTVVDKKAQDFNDAEYLEVRVDGEIIPPLLGKLKDVFAKNFERHIVLVLNSHGGYVSEGKEIIKFLQAEKEKGRQLWTRVKNGRACGSMCVPIYMVGQKRIAAEVSAFMFHGVTTAISNIPKEEATKEFVALLESLGVKNIFLEDLYKKGVFTLPGKYWLTGKRLVEMNSGVVAELEGHHEIYKPRELKVWPNRPK